MTTEPTTRIYFLLSARARENLIPPTRRPGWPTAIATDRTTTALVGQFVIIEPETRAAQDSRTKNSPGTADVGTGVD